MNKLLLAFVCSALLVACQKEDPLSDDRDKFLGTWNMNSNGSQSGHLAFTMEVIAGNSSPAQVIMKNFDFQGTNTNTIADVDGNSLSISPQLINGDTIEGTGSYSNSQLTFNYTVRDGITTDVVTATGTR